MSMLLPLDAKETNFRLDVELLGVREDRRSSSIIVVLASLVWVHGTLFYVQNMNVSCSHGDLLLR